MSSSYFFTEPLPEPLFLPELVNESDQSKALRIAYDAYLSPDFESYKAFDAAVEELNADEHGKLSALCLELGRYSILGQHPAHAETSGRLIVKQDDTSSFNDIPDVERADILGVSIDIVRGPDAALLKLRQAKDNARADAINKPMLVDDDAAEEYLRAEDEASERLADTRQEMMSHYNSILAGLDFVLEKSFETDDR